ncbi:MAG: TauD/TfdA family dioxygenase, partial [Pseudomonadota bacterium]
MSGKNWGIKRLSAALGAEVTGVELADAKAEDIGEIKSLLDEHKVLFVPDQHLSADAHVAFGRNFGHLEGHPNLKDR